MYWLSECETCGWRAARYRFVKAQRALKVVGAIALGLGGPIMSAAIALLPYGILTGNVDVASAGVRISMATRTWFESNYTYCAFVYFTSALAYSPKFDSSYPIWLPWGGYDDWNRWMLYCQIILAPGKLFWFGLSLPFTLVWSAVRRPR